MILPVVITARMLYVPKGVFFAYVYTEKTKDIFL